MFYDLPKSGKWAASAGVFVCAWLLLTALFGIPQLIESPKTEVYLGLLPQLWYIKLPVALLLAWLLVWLINSSLDIKSRKVGDGQHGSASWMQPDEKRKVYTSVRFDHETEPGCVVGVENDHWLIDTSDMNSIFLSPPGGGKSMCCFVSMIIYNARVNRNTNGRGASMLLTDCKGDLYRKTAATLVQCGIKPLLLDFRSPLNGLAFNLMHDINRSIDRYKAETDRSERLIWYAQAEKYAKILSASIVENLDTENDSEASDYFKGTAKGLITSLILLVSEYGEPDERHIISVFRLIIELNGLDDSAGAEEGTQQNKMSKLLSYVKNERITNYAGASIRADIRTVMNVFSTALQKLASFIDAELEQMVCQHSEELDFESFIREPSAIFLICPDENTTRHFFAALFIRYLSNNLIRYAEDCGGELPRKVLYLWDEFGNMPAIKDVDMLFSALRSRGIRIMIALQSFLQLEKNYTKARAGIIREACQMLVFTYVSPAALTTAQELSRILGNETVLTGSVTTGNGVTASRQMMGKPLLSPDEIMRLKFGHFIVFKSGSKPMKTSMPYCTEYLDLPPCQSDTKLAICHIRWLSAEKVKSRAVRHAESLHKGMFD